MEISEVKVKLMRNRSDRLKAFCSITIDKEFVIRDLKIIEGTRGMFVAMPSRKITDRCATCGAKNHLRAKFCNECGGRLDENRAGKDAEGRAKLHADIAHPINSSCRDRMQGKIIEAYEEELDKSRLPGYKPRYDDDFGEDDYAEPAPAPSSARPQIAEEAPQGDESDESAEGGEGAESGEGVEETEGDSGENGEGGPFGAGIF